MGQEDEEENEREGRNSMQILTHLQMGVLDAEGEEDHDGIFETEAGGGRGSAESVQHYDDVAATHQQPMHTAVSLRVFAAPMGAAILPGTATATTNFFTNAPELLQDTGMPHITSLEELVQHISFLDSRNRTTAQPAAAVVVDSLQRKTVTETCRKCDCCICMCDFEAGDETTVMPCGHAYHDSCIKEWLRTHNTCPVCRDALPTDQDVEDNIDPRERIARQ